MQIEYFIEDLRLHCEREIRIPEHVYITKYPPFLFFSSRFQLVRTMLNVNVKWWWFYWVQNVFEFFISWHITNLEYSLKWKKKTFLYSSVYSCGCWTVHNNGISRQNELQITKNQNIKTIFLMKYAKFHLHSILHFYFE